MLDPVYRNLNMLVSGAMISVYLITLSLLSACSIAPARYKNAYPESIAILPVTYKPDIVIQYGIDDDSLTGVEGCDSIGRSAGPDVSGLVFLLCLPFGMVGDFLNALTTKNETKKADEGGTIISKTFVGNQRIQEAFQESLFDYINKNNIKIKILPSYFSQKSLDDDIHYKTNALKEASTLLVSGIEKIEFFRRLGRYSIPVEHRQICLRLDVKAKLITSSATDILEIPVIVACNYLSDWKEYNNTSFKNLVDTELTRIIENIVNEFILMYYPEYDNDDPILKGRKVIISKEIPPYVQAAKSPEIISIKDMLGGPDSDPYDVEKYKSDHLTQYNNVIPEVGSLTPTIKWESFPFRWDKNITSNKFDNVVYEVKLYKAIKNVTENQLTFFKMNNILGLNNLKFSRENDVLHSVLTTNPYWEIKEPLSPCSVYFWTVRTKFNLNSASRITEWGGVYGDSVNPWEERRPGINNEFLSRNASRFLYYIFSTPAEPNKTDCSEIK